MSVISRPDARELRGAEASGRGGPRPPRLGDPERVVGSGTRAAYAGRSFRSRPPASCRGNRARESGGAVPLRLGQAGVHLSTRPLALYADLSSGARRAVKEFPTPRGHTFRHAARGVDSFAGTTRAASAVRFRPHRTFPRANRSSPRPATGGLPSGSTPSRPAPGDAAAVFNLSRHSHPPRPPQALAPTGLGPTGSPRHPGVPPALGVLRKKGFCASFPDPISWGEFPGGTVAPEQPGSLLPLSQPTVEVLRPAVSR